MNRKKRSRKKVSGKMKIIYLLSFMYKFYIYDKSKDETQNRYKIDTKWIQYR